MSFALGRKQRIEAARLEAQRNFLVANLAANAANDKRIQREVDQIDRRMDEPPVVQHRSWKYNRIFHDSRLCSSDFPLLERVFAEEWERECQPNRGINFGFGMLQDLLMDRKQPSNGYPGFPGHPFAVTIINGRDRMIAATVVQWLGTNVGYCFLLKCLKLAGETIVKADFSKSIFAQRDQAMQESKIFQETLKRLHRLGKGPDRASADWMIEEELPAIIESAFLKVKKLREERKNAK